MKKVSIIIVCITICSSLFVLMTQYLFFNKSGIEALLLENVEALVSEAGEGEAAQWETGKAFGSKEILTGWTSGYFPPYGNAIIPIYETIPCCVDSIQNNACNGAGLDPRC